MPSPSVISIIELQEPPLFSEFLTTILELSAEPSYSSFHDTITSFPLATTLGANESTDVSDELMTSGSDHDEPEFDEDENFISHYLESELKLDQAEYTLIPLAAISFL